jgi:hypothetical protein
VHKEKRLILTIETGKKTSAEKWESVLANDTGLSGRDPNPQEHREFYICVNGVAGWLLGGFSTPSGSQKMQRFLDLYGRN